MATSKRVWYSVNMVRDSAGKFRLLLVEFYFADRFSQFRSRYFPFLQGQARDLGMEVKWLCCWAPPGHDSRTRYVIDLDREDASLLTRAMAGFSPTHVIISEKLSEGLQAEVDRAVPDAKVENLAEASLDRLTTWPTAWMVEWLGMDSKAPPKGQLLDTTMPVYTSTAVNRPEGGNDPPVHVSAGVECIYKRKLSRNTFFKDLDIPPEIRPLACSFCAGPEEQEYDFKTDPVTLAVRQCVTALECDNRCSSRDTYILSGAYLFLKLGAFFREILKHPFPPSRFFFGCRIDELLHVADEIEGLLPQLAATGHSINIYNMGIENFSRDENERLNKGLSYEKIEKMDRILERFETKFPDTFRFSTWGGYGIILFTPWTTVDDLETNLQWMRNRRAIDAEGFALTSKLQILEESAVRLLAEKDGLLTDSFDDFHYYDSGCVFRYQQRDIPWKFKHPLIGLLYKIACRIRPITPFAEDDRLFSEAQEIFGFLQKQAKTPLDMFGMCLEVVRNAPEPGSSKEILERVRERFVDPFKPDAPAEDVPTGPSPALKRAGEILTTLAQKDPANLQGFVPQRVEERVLEEGRRRLVIELARGTERIILHMVEADPDGSAFLSTRRFHLRYGEEAPVDTPEKQHVACVVAASMERYHGGFSQDSDADGPADRQDSDDHGPADRQDSDDDGPADRQDSDDDGPADRSIEPLNREEILELITFPERR